MFIYPYRKGSNSVRALKETLGAKEIRLDNSKFVGGPNKNVLNWGNSSPFDQLNNCNLLNSPVSVGYASNKHNFFKRLNDVVNLPEYTTDRQQAHSWLEEGAKVVVREKLTGHSAEGLVLISEQDDWERYNHQNAKLYTKYIPKIDEYRVHVFNGEVIDIQKKSIPRGISRDRVNFQVRSHANGFIFTRGNITEIPKDIEPQCVTAIKELGLDFGAVDVIYNRHRNKSYLLEVNTAAGLEGTTLQNYANAISKYFGIKLVEKKNPVYDDAFDEVEEQPMPPEGAAPVRQGQPMEFNLNHTIRNDFDDWVRRATEVLGNRPVQNNEGN